MADNLTFVGATEGQWLETALPSGPITVTAHADTEDGDLVIVCMGGNDVPNTGMALRAVELGFFKTVDSGDVGVYYRFDVEGAESWDFYRLGIDNSVQWHCYTLRPVVPGSTFNIQWQAHVSFEALFQPMNWQQSELVVGQLRAFGYASQAAALAEHYFISALDDPDFVELRAATSVEVKYQSFPDRWENDTLQAWFRLNDDDLSGSAVTATIDQNVTTSRTDTGSARFSIMVLAPPGPTGSLNVLPTSGTRPLEVEADIVATDGPIYAVDTWELDWGDGTAPATGTGAVNATVTHTYQLAGAWDVTFSIVSTEPDTLDLGPTTVTVSDPAPVTDGGAQITLHTRRVQIQELPHMVTRRMRQVPR
jgi:hypothetical protein